MDQDLTMLLLSGAKLINRKHLIKLKGGLGAEVDRFHELSINKNGIPSTFDGYVLQVKVMLKDYYHQKGWQSDCSITDAGRTELHN